MSTEEKLSKLEYDVTNMRNVMDQLNTVEGVVNDALPYVKAQLALSLSPMTSLSDHKTMSGYMMKARSGKSMTRWSEVVSPAIGLGNLKYAGAGSKFSYGREYLQRDVANKIKSWTGVDLGWPVHIRRTKNNMDTVDRMSEWEKTFSRKPPDFRRRIENSVYDAMNLFRNINWELNRLRVEMPFDLRQLMNQLNNYAGSLTNSSKAGGMITTFKIFQEMENLKKKVIPKMKSTLTQRIKDRELQKKVALETLRKENEKTLTDEERKQRESEKEHIYTTMPVKSGEGVRQPTMPVDSGEPAKRPTKSSDQKENAKVIAQKTGDDNRAGWVAGTIALLALIGAG